MLNKTFEIRFYLLVECCKRRDVARVMTEGGGEFIVVVLKEMVAPANWTVEGPSVCSFVKR